MSKKEEELAVLRKEHRELQTLRIAEDSRNRLKRIAKRKFNTCFISAIAEFEKTFGIKLWGHSLPDNELTPKQKENKILWDQVRKTILDKGNTQSRALGMEIDLHSVEFEGYKMNCGRRKNG